MRNNYGDLDAQPTLKTAAEASGTDAVITIAAEETQFWAIDWISWSYGDYPTDGNLEVKIDGVVVWQVDITSGGPGHLEFMKPLYVQNLNTSVVITLSDGGTSNKVNVRYR